MDENELRQRLAVAEGNIAGMAALIGALVQSLPAQQLPALKARAEALFEPVEAEMLADADPFSEASLRGMRNVRNLLRDLLAKTS